MFLTHFDKIFANFTRFIATLAHFFAQNFNKKKYYCAKHITFRRSAPQLSPLCPWPRKTQGEEVGIPQEKGGEN